MIVPSPTAVCADLLAAICPASKNKRLLTQHWVNGRSDVGLPLTVLNMQARHVLEKT
jgi:hypothetical protein